MTQSENGPARNLVEPDDHIFGHFIRSVRDYAILMLDPSGRIISSNAGAEHIKGYRAHEIIGSHFSRFYPAQQVTEGHPDKELLIAARDGHFEDEGWRLRKDGSRFWANVIITALRDQAGALFGYATVTRDMTERRREEETLRQSEERYRALVSGVRDYAIFILDPDGFVTTWNAGAEYIKGYQAHEIIGSHFSRFYPPESIKSGLPERELRGATLDGRFEDEGWRVRKDGSRFWANVIITAMRDTSGKLIGFSKITRNLTDRRRQEENLRLSEERFRLLVEGVTEYAIIMLDRDGFVSSWNGGAERINGYKSHEILGKHLSNFYSSEDIAANRPWRHLATARDKGRSTEEGWRVRKDGTLFWSSTVITALTDGEGKPYGFAQVTQDLTQRRHAEALADTTQRMHEFIAMLAHELRNPLAPISNAVALMARKGLDDPALEAMRQTIERQSVHLTRLLDELLDVNRIARGQFAVDKESVHLQDVLERALETSRPLIDAQAHRLHLSVQGEPVLVIGDRLRLTQVFVNLLNNAAKYTPTGGEIWLSVKPRSTDVEIRVRDSGKGIEASMLEKVFDLFVQVDANIGSALGGLGVGLALVRRVVELHGGSVHARSEGAGQGSEFVVRLPLSFQALRAVGSPAKPVTAGILPELRVLVVDDNRDAADSLGLLLESMGQNVSTVYDGATALAAIDAYQPDIVMLDIGMPHLNGYQVAIEIRARAAKRRPYLIAVTGWGQESDQQRARESGFDRHFVKPVSAEALRGVVAEIARRGERFR